MEGKNKTEGYHRTGQTGIFYSPGIRCAKGIRI